MYVSWSSLSDSAFRQLLQKCIAGDNDSFDTLLLLLKPDICEITKTIANNRRFEYWGNIDIEDRYAEICCLLLEDNKRFLRRFKGINLSNPKNRFWAYVRSTTAYQINRFIDNMVKEEKIKRRWPTKIDKETGDEISIEVPISPKREEARFRKLISDLKRKGLACQCKSIKKEHKLIYIEIKYWGISTKAVAIEHHMTKSAIRTCNWRTNKKLDKFVASHPQWDTILRYLD